MYVLLSAILLMGTVLSAQAAEEQRSEPVSAQAEPCYVVIAVDVSGSMERSDEPVSDAAGRKQTLRDEGQLVFLQLLPFLRSDLYVGVAHFSDKVRYALPSSETGPLLSWGQTYLSESAYRNMVRPAEFEGAFKTDIAESMSWAAERIRAAREKYGDGAAKLIILSHGDPQDSERELNRGSGPVLQMAKRLAGQRIQVYPVLINSASFAGGRARLSSRELAAEDLMRSVASLTGGNAYRLAEDMGFADILMNVFDLGLQTSDDLLVTPSDWAVVMVGEPFESITVHPPAGVGGPGSLKLAGRGGLETAPGIYANIVPARRNQTCVLRRPETANMVNRLWQGRWETQWPQADAKAPARVYRIPEFLVRMEARPELPWWLHERVQLRAHLLDRHKSIPGLEGIRTADGKQRLSIRITAGAAAGTNSFLVEDGTWTVPGRVYDTDPLTVTAPGLYKVTCELRDRVGDVNVPILNTTSDVYVHSECVGLEVVSAQDQVLEQVPPVTAEVPIDAQGGQQVFFRMLSKGEFNVELMSGTLHLEPLSQNEWPLRKDAEGHLITSLVPLVEQEERLIGWAEVDVRTHAGVRRIQLPRFNLVYAPAPMQIECAFADPRETLWVGEYYRQPLTISAFPVFDRFLEQTVRLFPAALPEARIRTVDMQSGTTQAMGPQSRLLEPPRPSGYEGRTVQATYFVESANPIPPADKCEIDVRGVMKNLQGALRAYAVVDPVADGLFRWVVRQEEGGRQQSAVSETLFCGEPIRFSAQWRADQRVSAVRFEIPQSSNQESLFVDVPVESGTTSASLEQAVPGLKAGQTHPVYVHVTCQPPGANQPVQVKLKAGQFRTEDRRVVLADLTVGPETPTDIAAQAWEPLELPLQAVFSGYLSGDARHIATVEEFKKACKVTVTPRTGQVQDVTNTIEWLEVQVDGPARTCKLRGHAVYTPQVAGRATVEWTAEAPMARGATESPVHQAFANVMARPPHLAITIDRLTPGGQEPVFDSRQWVGGDGGLSTLITRFATHLRLNVQNNGWTSSPSLRVTVRLLRRAASQAEWLPTYSDVMEMAGSEPLSREVQATEPGEYAFEVMGQDPQSGVRRLYFQTPVVTSIRQQEVEPAMAPPMWLTSRVRQWPFEFRVTLYEDAVRLSRLQSLAFQFQLPGQNGTWFEGSALPLESTTADGRVLSVRSPQFMPAAGNLTNGVADFRLSSQGLEFMRWDYPNIRVIPPVLEGVVLSRKDGGQPIELAGAELPFDGTSDLWLRPVFRATPELEEQWAPAQMTVYLWPVGAGDPIGKQAEVRILESLEGQGKAVADVQSFQIDGEVSKSGVKVLPRRVRPRFWGLPKAGTSERYSLVASVSYRPIQVSGAAEVLPADRTIAEWSEVYAIDLRTPRVVPLCWWPITAFLVLALFAAVLRLFVPSPGKLALDMRLEENIAIVEPVRLDNPVLVDLHETPLAAEVRLYTRYLSGRWGMAGRNAAKRFGSRPNSFVGGVLETLVQGFTLVVAPARVVLRRALFPRRWAWAAIIPRTRGEVRQVRTALLCVWTGLATRRGRVWSSQSGPLELPQDGQVKSVNLDLPYWVDGVNRTMRVTVRIRRMASEEVGAVAGWQTGTEFES